MTTTATTVTTVPAATNPSPGKQPLSERELNSMFNSADTTTLFATTDLATLFASADSIMSMGLPPLGPAEAAGAAAPPAAASHPGEHMRSIDIVAGLMAGTAPAVSSQAFLAHFMTSRDSLFGSRDAALETFPLASAAEARVDLADNNEEGKKPVVLPGIYHSKEWMGEYKGNHKDIDYTKQVFKTGESNTTTNSKKKANNDDSKWFGLYAKTLANPIAPPPAVETSTRPPIDHQPVCDHQPPAQPEPKKKTAQKKKCPSRRSEPKNKVYVEPNEKDILSGRGGKSNNWPGNERYRQAIEDAKPRYRECAKYEKTILSQELVEEMMNEGRRFLKQDDSNGKWYLIPKLAARRKAGQALRELNTPESRAEKRERYRKD